MYFQFLSVDYPLEKSFFNISRRCLSWMGGFPQTHLTALNIVKFAFHCSLLSAGIIAQFCYGFRYIKEDLQVGLDAICPAIFCMVSCIKMVLVCWYGKELALVLKHLQDLFFADKGEEKLHIKKSFSLIATNLSFVFFLLAVLASVFYGLRPIVTNIIRVTLGMPYDFDDTSLRTLVPTVSLRLPWYPLTYTLIAYMGSSTGIAFTGVGGFYISFCLSAAALFQIVQADIRLSLEQFQNKMKLTKEENDICCQQLRAVVERQNEVIDMIEQFCGYFRLIVFLQCVTSSAVIGASIIEALLYPGYRAIVYMSYTLSALCELYIYCYGASAISENSTEIGMTAYCSIWYNCDTRVQKTILMIIIRSQKPVTMDVPFFSISLETFMSIVKTAGSVITLVQSVL